MELHLDQKVALVCASSAGIGKAIAQGLAAEGVHVSLFARTHSDIEATAHEIEKTARGRVIYQAGDLSNTEDIERIVKNTERILGPIDILINNQGGPAAGTLPQVTNEQLESAMNVNIRAVFQLTSLCLPSMKERGFGRIINVLSTSAKEPLPNMLLSNTVRPAILGFAKTLATEYAAFGITINSLLPSAVLTQRAYSLLEKKAQQEKRSFDDALASAAQSLPIKRIASPEEFAELAVFLCSPRASYITGGAISVDGGATHGLF